MKAYGRTRPPAPTSALAVALLALALLVAVGVAVARAGHEREPSRVVGYGQIRFNGAGPERWAQRYRQEHARVVALQQQLSKERRVLLARPDVVEAINLACATYGFCSTLWRKARCETGGTFDPGAYNPKAAYNGEHALGLFQFLPSTWRSTPYARFSVWSPYANALAAAWMHLHGRGGEWTCQ